MAKNWNWFGIAFGGVCAVIAMIFLYFTVALTTGNFWLYFFTGVVLVIAAVVSLTMSFKGKFLKVTF